MSKEAEAAEYAAMLAGGNVSIAWHSIDPKQFRFETIDKAMKQAVYRAIRQVYSDNLGMKLPNEMPDLFADDSAQGKGEG